MSNLSNLKEGHVVVFELLSKLVNDRLDCFIFEFEKLGA